MFKNMIMYLKHPRFQFLPLIAFIHHTCTIKRHFIAVSSILTKFVVGDYQNGILSPYSYFTKNIECLWVTKQSAIKKERDF